MSQKKALVTGGSSGVGLSIVRALVARGWEVHFVGRDAEKGRALEAELDATGPGTSHFVELDLSRLRQVRDFAVAFRAEHTKLHVLANVAGVMLPNRRETPEGLETTLAVGHLSAYLLSRELAALLAKAEHGRIINVAAKADTSEEQDLGDLTFQGRYLGPAVAMKTIHAKTVITQILAEDFAPQGIDVNAFSAGLVKSGLRRDLRFPLKQLIGFAQRFMGTESVNGIHAATAGELNGVTGHFIENAAEKAPLDFSQDYRQRLLVATDALMERALG